MAKEKYTTTFVLGVLVCAFGGTFQEKYKYYKRYFTRNLYYDKMNMNNIH
jgi:hypothetical protein